MSAKHLTPQMIARTVHVIDSSGILDILVPPRGPGAKGRIGARRANTRLLLLGLTLAARLGQETTVKGAHETLTQALPRDLQWELGVLRPTVTKSIRPGPAFDANTPRLTRAGKLAKLRWAGVEEVSYDDLHYAATVARKGLDFGHGTAPDLTDEQRLARREQVEELSDRLIRTTLIPRTGSTWAIDATGQWAWTRGPAKPKATLEKELRKDAAAGALEVTEIAAPEDADDPTDLDRPAPAPAKGRCLDARWGYKTAKTGEREVGYGFHMHTICRVPDPTADDDIEPLLIDGFVMTPADADVVSASLRLVDRIRARDPFRFLLGDALYTNLKASRWAVPLAERGVDQGLAMRLDGHKVVDINGAQMQHGWLHCPAAPMDRFPMPPDSGSAKEWIEHGERITAFQRNWAFDRKESGLGKSLTSKWICPARSGRVGCSVVGPDNVKAATDLGLPQVIPPDDTDSRLCCKNKTMDFTPTPDDPDHQRKLMQREYFGSERWRRLYKRRGLVEGAFGILKNGSRLRLRRGQNRIPGLAMATIVAALKVSLYNEEQLRMWHERTGLGPGDHPLLQPDPRYWGYKDLTQAEAEEIDARHLRHLIGGGSDSVEAA